MSLTEHPTEAVPEDVHDHIHSPQTFVADLDKLYVEVTSDDKEHSDVLRKSATKGLGSVPYTVTVDDGGDLELHVEVASLTPSPPDGAKCKVKIFIMRLPQHDLLAIADGGSQVIGDSPADTCLASTGAAIVAKKLPPLLERQLEAKR
jgi:hypothetical protein